MKILVATLVCYVFAQAVSGQRPDLSPRINLSEPYLLVNANDTWYLRCEGTRHVDWTTPSFQYFVAPCEHMMPGQEVEYCMQKRNESLVEMKQEDEDMKSRTSRVTMAHYDKSRNADVYESTLNVTASEYTDTGRYTCHYVNASAKDNYTSSVYVFVHDEKQLLKPVEGYVRIFQVDPAAVIPCIPTHPNVTVSLLRFPGNPSCVDNPVCIPKAVKKYLKFDPERGFIVPYPDRFYREKFTCLATLGNLSSSVTVNTNWKADTTKVEPPRIYKDEHDEPLLTGQTFVLHCVVLMDATIHFDQLWIYPESASVKNMSLPDFESVNVTFNRFSYSLKVTGAVAEDTSNYTCKLTLYSGREVRKSIFVRVTTRVKPSLVNTTLTGDLTMAQQGQDVEMVCIFTGIPEPNVTWYKSDEQMNTNTPGITIQDNASKLTITRVTAANAGDYSCKGENSEGFIVTNMTLHVDVPVDNAGIHIIGLIALGVASGVIFFIFSVVLANFVYRERKQRRDLAILQKMLFEQGDTVSLDPEVPLSDQVELLPYDRRWEVPRDKIKLGRPLGQGAFGRVVKAQAFGLLEDKEKAVTVAVKLIKERAELSHQKALLQELKIMIHLGRHPNILNLLGACTKNLHKGGVLVVVEYCSQGNLRHFLLHHRDVFVNQVDPRTGNITANASFMWLIDEDSSGARNQNMSGYDKKLFSAQSTICEHTVDTDMTNLSQADEQEQQMSDNSWDAVSTTGGNRRNSRTKKRQLTTCDILCMAFQVARGMDYLASKRLVHRDLAARNILLTEDNIVKICDFGLAKDLYNATIYKKKGNGPLPVKWMALESIRDRVFSSQSDVWSFGIVLWELFTLGGNPYPGVEVDEEFFQKLVKGYRLGKPDFASSDIYAVMRDCWKAEAKDRPTFSELVERIGSQLDENIKKYYVNLSVLYPIPEVASADEYVPMDVCKADGGKDIGDAKASTPPETRYVNLPETRGQTNDYLIMDSPTTKSFAENFVEDLCKQHHEMNGYVNAPHRLSGSNISRPSMNMQLNLKNACVPETEMIPMVSVAVANDSPNSDEPHYRIPPSGKAVDPDRFRNDSDTSSGIVADIGHHLDGTFV